MAEQKKSFIVKVIDKALTIFLWSCGIFTILMCIQIFCLTSFKIPSDSMKPELMPGDYILVNKLPMGARLFNIFSAINGEEAPIYRLPGISKIKRNDVLAFNFPYPNRWDSIGFDVMKYYMKRCIGLPGDSVKIINGTYRVEGYSYPLGNIEAQTDLSKLKENELPPGTWNTFPWEHKLGWNIKDFGPLYIPQKGKVIPITPMNIRFYGNLMKWEQKQQLTIEGNKVYLDNKQIHTYQFTHNYYFMGGDNVINSQDSRYWGMLPEEFIVGKAWIIWKSVNINNKKLNWRRILKKIN